MSFYWQQAGEADGQQQPASAWASSTSTWDNINLGGSGGGGQPQQQSSYYGYEVRSMQRLNWVSELKKRGGGDQTGN